MRPIEEVYPGLYESGGMCGPAEYEPLLESIAEVVVCEEGGNYQDDCLVILRREGGQYGLLMFGYGSCTVCDLLQACESYPELARLREQMADSVIWMEDLAGVKELVAHKAWDLTHWMWVGDSDDLVSRFKAAVAAL